MAILLCEQCGVRPASVFFTSLLDNVAAPHQLCSDCARSVPEDFEAENAQVENAPTETPLFEALNGALQSMENGDSSERSLRPEESQPEQGTLEWFIKLNELPGEEDNRRLEKWLQEQAAKNGEEVAQLSDEDIENLLPAKSSTRNAPPTSIESVRCPKCGMTWDRLKQDGRAGCGQCYEAFARELANVMERVQKSSQHLGKTPRAMEKRRLRLKHLRVRRDNRLEMLKRRLEESLSRENYEEAAKLRDKIKVVASTILDVE